MYPKIDSTRTSALSRSVLIRMGRSYVFSRSLIKKEQSIASVFSVKPFQKLWKYTKMGGGGDDITDGQTDGQTDRHVYYYQKKIFIFHPLTRHRRRSLHKYKLIFILLPSFTCFTNLSTTSFVTANGNATFSDISFSNSGVSGLIRRYKFNLR